MELLPLPGKVPLAPPGKALPVEPTVDNNWRITGVDLSKDDPRRAEIIGYINDGLLPTPLRKSYNLADYDELKTLAEENRKNGIIPEETGYDH